MNEFRVMTPCNEVADLLIDLAKKSGRICRCSYSNKCIYFHCKGAKFFTYDKLYKEVRKFFISLDEAIKILTTDKIIKIDNYNVEFRKDSIKVGCQTISKKKVEEIYKKLFLK